MPKHKTDVGMSEVIRAAIQRDERSLYKLMKDSGVSSAVLLRFVNGERDMNLRTADRVCRVLGLKLVKQGKAG